MQRVGGSRPNKVPNQQCVMVWENERWTLSSWKFMATRQGRIDPPHMCDVNGRPTTMAQIDEQVARNALTLEQTTSNNGDDAGPAAPVGIRKVVRWAPGAVWRSGPWFYATAFNTQFRPTRETTSFVRKRQWVKASESYSPRRDSQSMNTDGRLARRGVSFSQDTIYEREMDNKKWKACAATRNGPRWVQQYRTDCKSCDIDARISLAALLASPGYGAFEKQANARQLLAGVLEWPVDSPATTVAQAGPGKIDYLCEEIFSQLIDDMSSAGVDDACETALQTLAMVTLNAHNRETDDAVPNTNAESPTELNTFIENTITILSESQKDILQTDLGWDAAEGWFVIDDGKDEFEAARVNPALETAISMHSPSRESIGESAEVNTDELNGTSICIEEDESVVESVTSSVGSSVYFDATDEAEDAVGEDQLHDMKVQSEVDALQKLMIKSSDSDGISATAPES